jgi:hypothetical protein
MPMLPRQYDRQKDKAYWIHIRAYISNRSTPELFAGGDTISTHIPIGSRINPRAIRAIARCKNDIHKQIDGKGTEHV